MKQTRQAANEQAARWTNAVAQVEAASTAGARQQMRAEDTTVVACQEELSVTRAHIKQVGLVV